MTKTPKRPRDFSQAAKLVVDIASGQIKNREPTPEEQGKDPAAVARGKQGGLKGGKARAAARVRLKSGIGRETMRRRGQLVERSFAHVLDRGGMRRAVFEPRGVVRGPRRVVVEGGVAHRYTCSSFLHEGIKNARDLIILFTGDYEQSPYTRKEFTSFEAERLRDERDRHIVVLRCDDAPLRGLLADTVYQDLIDVAEPEERKRRILAAAERRSSAERPQRRRGRTFVGVPPRIAGFTGRADELDRLDAILVER